MQTENTSKSMSSQKMKYEAEVSVIKSKTGDIEDIRSSLGLSQRKISQLLMVDPSAWTRWASGHTKTPSHIYRALQWYLALIEKNPEWHPQNSFMKAFQNTNATDMKKTMQGYKVQMEKQIRELDEKTQYMIMKDKTSKWTLKALAILCIFQALVIALVLLK